MKINIKKLISIGNAYNSINNKELGERINSNPVTISTIKRNGTCNLNLLFKILAVFKVKLIVRFDNGNSYELVGNAKEN